MPVKRVLITEVDEGSHATVIGAIKALYKVAKDNAKHLYLITVKRDTPLVYALKKNTTIKRLLKSSMENPNSILRWETLNSQFCIQENSIVICPYMFLSDIEIIDTQMPNNAEMVVIELNKDERKDWYDRWNRNYLDGNLWSDVLPEVLYKGLANLTSSINVVNPHKLDDDRVKTAIRVIHKFLPQASPLLIKDILISDFHWRLDYASSFVNRLEGLNKGKYFQGGETTGLKKIFDRWSSLPFPKK